MTRRYSDRCANRSLSRLERVLAFVDRQPSGCWLWTAYTCRGYGRISIGSEGGLYVHRVVYEEMVGPIPEGMQIDHLCRVTNCVNPAHLEAVTPLVNTRRSRGNNAKTACPQGHAYDAINTYRYDGRRHCRACQKARRLARKEATA